MCGFSERMKDRAVLVRNCSAPGYILPVACIINGTALEARGLEYQLRWKPLRDTEIWVNQTFTRVIRDISDDKGFPPTRATTIALFQKLPRDFDLSVIFHTTGAMSWANYEAKDILPAMHRVDLRLAYPFRIGSTRAEAAVTVQAANGSYPEYRPRPEYLFDRRAYGTLRFEF